MKGRNRAAPFATPLVLAIAWLTVAPAGHHASAGQSAHKSRDAGRSYVLEGRRAGHRRFRSQKIYLPVGPAYVYYDYPYYYARGYYPTHIGGYVYYIPKYRSRCAGGNRRCSKYNR